MPTSLASCLALLKQRCLGKCCSCLILNRTAAATHHAGPTCPPPKTPPHTVLYDAGVDPHVDDTLGNLALTDEGLRRRELLVSAWQGCGCLTGGV